ncbi:hypothetical protein [Cardinium endosymbiont of Tipula unca]
MPQSSNVIFIPIFKTSGMQDLKFNIVAGLVNLQNGLSLLKRVA